MPNQSNITAPITIFGSVESGAKLVANILGSHRDCQNVAETSNLIHGVARAQQSSLPQMRWKDIPQYIREEFLFFFPATDPHWIQCMLGVPKIARRVKDESELIDSYWERMEQAFPDAKIATVLRHPLDDIAASWETDDQRELVSIVDVNRLIAELICAPQSKVELAIEYDELFSDPQNQIAKLLSFAELDNDLIRSSDCFKALDAYSSGEKMETPVQEARKQIEPAVLTDAYREAIESCWNKFDRDFGGWDF